MYVPAARYIYRLFKKWYTTKWYKAGNKLRFVKLFD